MPDLQYRVSFVPLTTEPSDVSMRMSDRFRPSSTKYGPSVISGLTTQLTAFEAAVVVAAELLFAAATAAVPTAVNVTPAAPNTARALRLLSTRPTGLSSSSTVISFVR